MINFLTGLASVAILFVLSLGVSLIACFVMGKIRESSPKEETEKPKIYYIKNVVKEKKKRRSPHRKTDIALKGIVLDAEEFEKTKDKL